MQSAEAKRQIDAKAFRALVARIGETPVGPERTAMVASNADALAQLVRIAWP